MNTFDKLPESLKTEGLFCLYRKETLSGGRTTKIPFNPRNGGQSKAHADNPGTFAPFQISLAAYEKARQSGAPFDGLGVLLQPPLVGVDIDHAVDPATGAVNAVAADILAMLHDAYAEQSPSGTGLHLLFRCPGYWFDRSRYKNKNTAAGVEVYTERRFFTITGARLNNNGLAALDAEKLDALLEKYLRRPTVETSTAAIDAADETDALDDFSALALMAKGRGGETWRRLYDEGDFTAAGYGSQSEADLALCNTLAFYCGRNRAQIDRLFRGGALMRPKWDELRGGTSYGEQTIDKAIRGTVNAYDPSYRPKMAEDEQAALDWLNRQDLSRSTRYTADSLGVSYLLADFLKPTARYCDDLGGVWFAFDGQRWRKDPKACLVAERTKTLGKAIARFASMIEDDNSRKAWLKLAGRMCDTGFRRNLIDDARSVHTVSQTEFDCNGALLNCLNGTLDLRTLELREHNPDDLITKLADAEYHPGAKLPRWGAFVQEIFPDDPDTLDFLQRWLGYALCGDLSEEKMVMARGRSTRNGKSTLFEAVARTLGDYATAMNPESLAETNRSDGRAPSEDIARLRGARFVTIPEPKKTLRLDASRVKQMTGGDTIIARMLNENSVAFRSVAHLTMNANRLPEVNDLTLFSSGRVLLVPFSRHFEDWEQDTTLKAQFSTDEAKSAILAWLVEGLRRYRRDRLKPSAAMTTELQEYRESCDKVSRFISELLPQADDPTEKVPLAEVYSRYTEWCRSSGCYPEARHSFAAELGDRGIQITRRRPTAGGEKTTVVIGRKLLYPFMAYQMTKDEEQENPAS